MWNLEDQEQLDLQPNQQEQEAEQKNQSKEEQPLSETKSSNEFNQQISDDFQDIIINGIEDASQILIKESNIDYSSSRYINYITNDINKSDTCNELHQQDDDLLELTTSQYIQPSCSNTHDNDSNLTYHSLNETQNYGIFKKNIIYIIIIHINF
jgi:hypothetical protein